MPISNQKPYDQYWANVTKSVSNLFFYFKYISDVALSLSFTHHLNFKIASFFKTKCRNRMNQPPYLDYSAQLMLQELNIESLPSNMQQRLSSFDLEDIRQWADFSDVALVYGWSQHSYEDFKAQFPNSPEDTKYYYFSGIAFGGFEEKIHTELTLKLNEVDETNLDEYIRYISYALYGYARSNQTGMLENLLQRLPVPKFMTKEEFQKKVFIQSLPLIIKGFASANNLEKVLTYINKINKINNFDISPQEKIRLEHIPNQNNLIKSSVLQAISGFVDTQNFLAIDFLKKKYGISEEEMTQLYKEKDTTLAEVRKTELTNLLASYLDRRENIYQRSIPNSPAKSDSKEEGEEEKKKGSEYFYFFSPLFGGKRYSEKKEAIFSLTVYLHPDIYLPSVIKKPDVKILNNGQLGRQLRQFITSGKANELLSRNDITNVEEFINALVSSPSSNLKP